jgi:uncharacterized protein (TIGR04552 family)
MPEKNQLNVDTSIHRALSDSLSLSDLETVRLILRGDSIIDWNRANFRTTEEAERFLQLHHFSFSNPNDMRRLKYLRDTAVSYLEDQFQLRFPDDIKYAQDLRSILVMASLTGGFRRKQILCCVVLKLMHVLQHLDAAELRHQIPLAEVDLLELAAQKIDKAGRIIKKSGLPIVSFYGSRKARNSIITKLLAKSDNIAATVFDKLRYRIVTERPQDILSTLVWLSRNLFPFNYVIPEESHNNLISFDEMSKKSAYADLFASLQSNGIEYEESRNGEDNTFSGSNYRIINFIVDVPVRIDHVIQSPQYQMLGNVLYVMVEFQVLDEETAIQNEQGDSAHRLYKQRQLEQVRIRLRKGGRKKRTLSQSTDKSD